MTLLSPLVYAQPVLQCLAGGRSPASWKRMMMREATVADWLDRSCSWPVFLNDARPSLRAGPLLGTAIDVLTKDGYRPERESPSRAGRRRFSSVPAVAAVDPTAAVRRGRVRATGTVLARSRQQAGKCLGQPVQASREFLSWLAGGASATEYLSTVEKGGYVKAGAAERPRISVAKDRQASTQSQAKTKKNRFFYDAEALSTAGHLLAESLVTRAAGHLFVSAFDGQRFAAIGTAALAAQWSSLLSGPAVPGELLDAGYEAGYREGETYREESGHREPTGRSAGNGWFDTTSSREDSSRLSQNEGSWQRARREARSLTQPRGERTDFPRSAPVAEPAEVSAAPVMPLRSLPSGMRRAFPPAGAASMAVVDSEEKESVSHDDLSALSAQLKRILDEEARRHGIDV